VVSGTQSTGLSEQCRSVGAVPVCPEQCRSVGAVPVCPEQCRSVRSSAGLSEQCRSVGAVPVCRSSAGLSEQCRYIRQAYAANRLVIIESMGGNLFVVSLYIHNLFVMLVLITRLFVVEFFYIDDYIIFLTSLASPRQKIYCVYCAV